MTPTPHHPLSSPSTRVTDLAVVALLSLPAIVGTGVFLAGALVSTIFGPGDAPGPSQERAAGDDVVLGVAVTIYFMCYFGAAFGPILLPLAGWRAFAVARAAGALSRVSISAWTIVGLGIAAAALFWGWLITLDLFI
jgi:hypothetical protein